MSTNLSPVAKNKQPRANQKATESKTQRSSAGQTSYRDSSTRTPAVPPHKPAQEPHKPPAVTENASNRSPEKSLNS
jgi:hypothetical protein